MVVDVIVVVMEMVEVVAVVVMMARISGHGIGSACGCDDRDGGGEVEGVSGIDGNDEKGQPWQ